MNPAIRIDNLKKCFRIGKAPAGGYSMTERLLAMGKSTYRKFKQLASPSSMADDEVYWALRGVSFEVGQGEVVGVIGRNGAGKSTLLKLISRISAPTSGRIEVRGRMGSLLEVGTGFHPELTGRENIFLNGSILGMSQREIRAKFDSIVNFSGISQFIDTPVKRFSSGMYVRLAFAVAAFLEPEILVVDEVLAVGDALFQRRCIDRMTELAQGGRTILFVSHNMQLIPRLCQRAVLLEQGEVVSVGGSSEVTQLYLDRMLDETRKGDLRDKPRKGGDGRARFQRAWLVDDDGNTLTNFISGDDLIIRMELEAFETLEKVDLAVVIQSLYGMRLITSWSPESGFQTALTPGMHTFECRFREVRIRPGHMVLLDVWMASSGITLDFVEQALVVDVLASDEEQHISSVDSQGIMLCDNEWTEVTNGVLSGR